MKRDRAPISLIETMFCGAGALTYVPTHAGTGVGGDDDALVEDEGERGGPLLVVQHLLGRLLEPIELPPETRAHRSEARARRIR